MYNSQVDFTKVKNQIIAICIANIGTFAFGNSYGWLSPSLVTLKSPDNTPLVLGPVTVDEITWIVISFGIGCIGGQICGAILSGLWGTKWGIAASAVPALLFWLLIIFGNYIEYIYVARVFSGISGGILYYLIPLFVADISDPIIRGRLGTLMLGSQCLGILSIYVVASYVDYNIVPYVFLPFPIVFFSIFLFIPHSPQQLMMDSNIEIKKVEKSIRFYHNLYDDSSETQQKIKEKVENVRSFINDRLTTEKLKLSDFTTKEALHGSIKSILLLSTYIGAGNLIFFSFADSIFRDSGSNFDSNISSIIIAIIQLCGVFLATSLIDKIGRQKLLILSTIGCTIGLTSMGLFNYLSIEGYDVNVVNWVPVTSMAVTLLSGSCGILPVTFVLLAEIFPAKIRRVTSLTVLIFMNALLTISTSCFTLLADLYGLYTSFWLLAVLECLGIFFSIFIFQDTTGKNIN